MHSPSLSITTASSCWIDHQAYQGTVVSRSRALSAIMCLVVILVCPSAVMLRRWGALHRRSLLPLGADVQWGEASPCLLKARPLWPGQGSALYCHVAKQ